MIVNKIKNLIRTSSLPLDSLVVGDVETHGVFAYRVPSELVERSDFTLMLISELRNFPDKYAGDHSTQLRQRFQIQIWYKPETDVDSFEWQLTELLEDQGYYAIENVGHSLDEETGQLKIDLRYEGLADMPARK
ncbi:DUF806 family protein [Weissella confusa]|uniref:DUF806 family protein n=1 Tax=Weissella confusa TaxID=1583 RepID=UPI00223A8416|nr:DUF806 family protein [Weissella confusa]MCS9991173.1 DUF806 family protein [Weissella confusa]